MSLKAMIVILVVITGIFIAVLVVGGTQDGKGDAGTERNGIVDRIESAAGGAATIKLDQVDIPDNCDTDDPTLLAVVGTCQLTVHNDSKSVKVLRLTATPPVTITAPAPRGDNVVTADTKPGETTKVAVGEGDTVVSLSCFSNPPGTACSSVRIES
jgi:hypothetical protein